MWFMPTSANINLLFYDKDMFREAGIAPLRIGMTWGEFEETLAQLQAKTGTQEMPRVFLDETNDSLYAHAYSSGNGCRVGPCMTRLNAGNITPTFDWYKQMTADNEFLIDLTHVPDEDRDLVAARLTSAFREVGVWVESVVDYEYHLDITPIGVVPFPASEGTFTATGSGDLPPVGVSPLRLDGHIMSQYSTNPYWTWQWLKFLSYQSPAPRFRHVPARPSVAQSTNYWNILTPDLREPIQAAFPLARPILIGEEKVFSWERLAEVSNGTVSVENAGNLSWQVGWFGVGGN
jgi:ABC-type glycerol-3-phosphate transport system substrate-binding protein